MLNVYKIADDYADYILDEMEDSRDEDRLLELAEQYADDSAHVIYYGKAHEFVQALPLNRRMDAEQEVADCGLINDSITYDSLATLIAYFALKTLIMDNLGQRLEAVWPSVGTGDDY